MLAPLAPHLAEELWQKIRLSVLGYQLSDKSSSVVSQSVTDRLKTGEPESENRKRETDNWSVHQQPWPEAGEIRPEEEITLAVMVNGKTRGTLTIFNFQLSIFNEEEIKRMAQEKVEKWLEGKKIQKIVFVPGKVVNFVI
jgi:leucyl-tRNA synthetase